MKNGCRFSARKARGFSLIELASVLVIILALLALSLPTLLRARETATEAAAMGALRTITVGQTTYLALYQGYAPSLEALGPPKKGQLPSFDGADLIDAQLASGFRSGYIFRYVVLRRDQDGMVIEYLVTAEPAGGGTRPMLFVGQSGVVSVGGSGLDGSTKAGTVGGAPQ